MASDNVTDWDEPLSSDEPTVNGEEEEEEENGDEILRRANLEKLQRYVARMAYRPVAPPFTRPRTQKLAQPRKVVLLDNYNAFRTFLDPKQRSRRLKRMTDQYAAISAEQFEGIVRTQRLKDRKKEEMLKRKQDIFYEMLSKLETQCRQQYLNVLIKKFANFIANLATTMNIPSELVEPYSRMQRGIFCNILLAIGIQPTDPTAMVYNTPHAREYEVCHKLAHALLSLIIKALDSAATMNPDLVQPHEPDVAIDNYIKERLMCAAEKKILNSRQQSKYTQPDPILVALKKCEYNMKDI